MITATRKAPLNMVVLGLVLASLLFPTFSTADDFHVCQRSLAILFSTPNSNTQALTADHELRTPDETVCVACLWSTFENAATPSLPVIEPDTTLVGACQPQQVQPPFNNSPSVRTGRSPPLS